MKKKFVLFFALLCQVLGVAAEDKVYISNFSINAGETKRIELCFDTESTDITRLEGTVTMPAGLTVQNQAATGYTWMSGNGARTGGALVSYNPNTGGVIITSGQFTAGTGAVGYIDVMASTTLASTSTITITGFTVKKTDNSTADVASQNCTVTLGDSQGGGEGGGEGGGGDEQGDAVTFAFSPTSLTLAKGQTATVDVTLTNDMALTGMQATLSTSNGVTITNVTRGDRAAGRFNYNGEKGTLMILGGISGNEGTVFTISLKVDDEFTGSALLTVGGLKVTTAGAKSISASDITLPITVTGLATLSLSKEKIALKAGESDTVSVLLSSGADMTGFQSVLTLPENVTATLSNKISEYYLSYNPNNGKIIYMGGLAGESIPAGDNIRLFTLTLTGGAEFNATSEATLTGIKFTTSSAQSIGVPDVTIPVELAVTLGENDDNSALLEALDGQTCTVTLDRANIVAGMWNTVAVPFTISAEKLTALQALLGEGATLSLKTLESSSLEDESLSLNFIAANEIEAGKPYLLKVSKDIDLSKVAFDGVVISKDAVPTVTEAVTLVPTLGLTEVTGEKESILFMKSGNKLANPATLPSNMKGFRAYFQIAEGSSAREFVLNTDYVVTGIVSVDANAQNNNENIYTLEGVRVNNSARKGVYIMNGKKVIIK